MGVDHLRLHLCHSLVLYRKLCFMIRGDPQKWLLHLYILCFHCHALRSKNANCRVVTKISSFWVNTISRQGVKQLGISFGSIFLLFSNKYIYIYDLLVTNLVVNSYISSHLWYYFYTCCYMYHTLYFVNLVYVIS